MHALEYDLKVLNHDYHQIEKSYGRPLISSEDLADLRSLKFPVSCSLFTVYRLSKRD